MNFLNDTFIRAHGLNARRIRLHQRRILQSLQHEINTDIAIEDICSTNNGGIVSSEKAKNFLNHKEEESEKWQKKHVVSCIPAAGAASRFFIELQSFVTFMSQQLEFGLPLNPNGLFAQFPFLQRLVRHVTGATFQEVNTIEAAYSYARILIENYSQKPKLLVPATVENDTFLKLKMEEQIHLFPCLGTTLVVPYKMKKEIQTVLYQLKPKEYEKWLVLEQDHKLSTIRFNRDGSPYFDDKGKLSLVSAGHGELLHLFDSIADHFPKAHALHVRNIDNIIGISPEQKEEINIPLQLFYQLRTTLEFLRKKIPLLDFKSSHLTYNKDFSEQLNFMLSLTNNCILPIDHEKISCIDLYNLLRSLFHWQKLSEDLSHEQIWKMILENCERPLSVFGVVKKEKGDMGGGPVFAKVSDGSTVKLCMEMPHANGQDAKNYFSDTGKSTHFNPALVFFELRTHTHSEKNAGKKVNFVQLFDERFWLLTKREYKGKPVCYHETVLYELIGNSATTNLVFVDVPRSLFKPHKSYIDCLEQNRESYGFNKNFEP